MMFTELYQYLIQHKQLPVPGIGTFLLERRPATLDFANKKIEPPSYSFALDARSHLPGQHFFGWLSTALGIPGREAVFRFNDFVVELKKQISEGAVVNWHGVGTLNKSLDGTVRLSPATTEWVIEKPVVAEKITREKAEHMVRVGEDQKTSTQMTEMLNQKDESTTASWWPYALAVALLATMFIGWYFSEHGVDMSSIANNAKLIPLEAGAGYVVIP